MTERAIPSDSSATQSPASDAGGIDRIRDRAYELYQQRGGGPGDPDSDWYRAEAEINGGAGEAPE